VRVVLLDFQCSPSASSLKLFSSTYKSHLPALPTTNIFFTYNNFSSQRYLLLLHCFGLSSIATAILPLQHPSKSIRVHLELRAALLADLGVAAHFPVTTINHSHGLSIALLSFYNPKIRSLRVSLHSRRRHCHPVSLSRHFPKVLLVYTDSTFHTM
jgi:hypothetical protein